MKITPYDAVEDKNRAIPPMVLEDYGPAWWVTEQDGHAAYAITLGEVLGTFDFEALAIDGGAPGQVGKYAEMVQGEYLPAAQAGGRAKAVHFLRRSLEALLRNALGAEALPFDGHLSDLNGVDLCSRLVSAVAFRMVDHQQAGRSGLCPTAVMLDISSAVIERERRLREGGQRTETARTFAKIRSELRDLFSIARDRLSEPVPIIASTRLVKYSADTEWKSDMINSGWLGYIETAGDDPPASHLVRKDGEIVPIERITFEDGLMVSWVDAEGKLRHADGSPAD